MTWLSIKDELLPDFAKLQQSVQSQPTVSIEEVILKEGKTQPPDYLTESELISLVKLWLCCI